MDVLGRILRTVSLAIIFGGSVAVVCAAITLVNAAKAHGVEVSEAAATNAPAFLMWGKVNLAFGMVLLIGEALDYAKRRIWNKWTIAQYGSSLLCVIATMIFALGIIPGMEQMLPQLKDSEPARAEFHTLHETSRKVFGATIVLALISLLLPVFGALQPSAGRTPSDTESA